jgi:hypothetical protein
MSAFTNRPEKGRARSRSNPAPTAIGSDSFLWDPGVLPGARHTSPRGPSPSAPMSDPWPPPTGESTRSSLDARAQSSTTTPDPRRDRHAGPALQLFLAKSAASRHLLSPSRRRRALKTPGRSTTPAVANRLSRTGAHAVPARRWRADAAEPSREIVPFQPRYDSAANNLAGPCDSGRALDPRSAVGNSSRDARINDRARGYVRHPRRSRR